MNKGAIWFRTLRLVGRAVKDPSRTLGGRNKKKLQGKKKTNPSHAGTAETRLADKCTSLVGFFLREMDFNLERPTRKEKQLDTD